MARRGTIQFETSRGSVVLGYAETKAFQERLSQAPGGRPLERQIQQAIDHHATVMISEDQTAAAVSVLAMWFEEFGEVSPDMGKLLVMLQGASR